MVIIQKNFDSFSKNRSIILLFLMFTVIVFITSISLYHKHLKNYEYKITITLDNKTTTNNKMAIMFYSYNAKFSPNNSINSNHIDNEIIFQKIFYNSLKNIRFDIVNAKEDFYIKNITVSFNGKEKIINYNQIMEYFRFQHIEPNLDNDSLLCVSLNHDPMIIAKPNFIKLMELKNDNSKKYILKILAFDILVLMIFTAIIYYFRKKISEVVSLYVDKKTSKLNLFVITIILSIVMAAILEYIFICIGNLPYKEINYSNINYFYLPRYLFFLIWTFTIFFVFYIGKENAIKFRYAIVLFLLFILTLGNYNLSSHTIYENYLLDKTEDYKPSVIIGSPKAIRVDEYFTEKPYYFAQALSSEFLPYYNDNLMVNGQDMVVSAFAPVNDIIMLAKPELWGYFFLPYDHAFAFYWWFKAFFFIMCIFEFFYYFTKRSRASLLAALIMYFSPPVQWPFSQNTSNIYPAVMLALLLFDKYLKEKLYLKKIVYLTLLFFCIMIFIMVMYPAGQVPAMYFATIFGLFLVYSNRKVISRKHIIEIVVMLIPIVLMLYHFYTKSYVAIQDITNTVYPGTNRNWGRLFVEPLQYLTNYFYNFIAPYPERGVGEFVRRGFFQQFNFILVLIAYLLFIFIQRIRLNNFQYPILISILVLTLILLIGNIGYLRNFGLLNLTFSSRIFYSIEFLTMILFLNLIICKPLNGLLSKSNSIRISIGLTLVLLILILLDNFDFNLLYSKKIVIFLIISLLTYFIVSFFIFNSGNKGRNILLSLIFILSIQSTFFINPINYGVDAIYGKTVSQDIMKLNKQNDLWIYNGTNISYSVLLSYVGVKHIGGVYYYPDLLLFEKLNLEQYNDIYNKFSYVYLQLIDDNITIKRNSNPLIFHLLLPYEYIGSLGISYILSSSAIPNDIMINYKLKLYKYYPLENLYLYKVNR